MQTAFCTLLMLSFVPLFGETFSALPSGGTSAGQVGDVVGWGYSIENDTSLWLVPMGLSANGILFGSLTDVFDYGVVAPHSNTAVAFHFAAPGGPGFSVGLFEYLIPGNTPAGLAQSGFFILQYQFFSDNPDTNSSALLIGPILTFQEQAFSVLATEPVPEPGSVGLVLLAVACWRLWTWRFGGLDDQCDDGN